MNVVQVCRTLIGGNGSRIVHPMKTYKQEDAETLVKEFTQQQQAWLDAMMTMHVCEMTPQGARGVMPVPQLFMELGIANIGLITLTSPVSESNLVTLHKPLVNLQ